MNGADEERAERIARYEAAYFAAHGHETKVHYTGRRYRIAGGFTKMTGPELDRAAERLEQRAKGSSS